MRHVFTWQVDVATLLDATAPQDLETRILRTWDCTAARLSLTGVWSNHPEAWRMAKLAVFFEHVRQRGSRVGAAWNHVQERLPNQVPDHAEVAAKVSESSESNEEHLSQWLGATKQSLVPQWTTTRSFFYFGDVCLKGGACDSDAIAVSSSIMSMLKSLMVVCFCILVACRFER